MIKLVAPSLLLLGALQAGAAAASEPSLTNAGKLGAIADYPDTLIEAGRAGVTSVRLAVSPDGRVSKCDVVESSDSARLDRATCDAFLRRARFTPARDERGAAVQGEYHSVMGWTAGSPPATAKGDMRYQTIADVALSVRGKPADYRQPASLKLFFGPTGKPSRCAVTTSSGSAGFDALACREASGMLHVPPPRSDTGSPMAVRYARVGVE